MLNAISMDLAMDSNPTATALDTLFNAYYYADRADKEGKGISGGKPSLTSFHEKYQISLERVDYIKEVTSKTLFVALARVAREFSLKFTMKGTNQFARRLVNDKKVIESSGFEISWREGNSRTRWYSIKKKRDVPVEEELLEIGA